MPFMVLLAFGKNTVMTLVSSFSESPDLSIFPQFPKAAKVAVQIKWDGKTSILQNVWVYWIPLIASATAFISVITTCAHRCRGFVLLKPPWGTSCIPQLSSRPTPADKISSMILETFSNTSKKINWCGGGGCRKNENFEVVILSALRD